MTQALTVRINGRELPTDPAFAAEMEVLSHSEFSACYQCMTCSLGCPIADYMDYPPHQLIRLVQMGCKDEVFSCGTMQLCVSCETCTARCPNGVHIDVLIDALRIRASQEGVKPKYPQVRQFHKAFLWPIRWWGRVFELGFVARLKMTTFNFFQDAFSGAMMFLKGKLSLIPHSIKGKDEVRRIFNETIDKKP